MLNLWLLASCTITVTSGLDKKFNKRALISACNWTGLRPLARMSPASGKEIRPSGRTTTLREISGSFHTFTARRSSGPITYSSEAAGGAAGVVFALLGGAPARDICHAKMKTGMTIADLFRELISFSSYMRLPDLLDRLHVISFQADAKGSMDAVD